jgi:predicted transcriptional regulator
MNMGMTEQMHQVLAILASNVRDNPTPHFVDTQLIAGQLGITVQETKQLLRSMHAQGTVESSADCDFSLITPTGLSLHHAEYPVVQLAIQENANCQYSCLSF